MSPRRTSASRGTQTTLATDPAGSATTAPPSISRSLVSLDEPVPGSTPRNIPVYLFYLTPAPGTTAQPLPLVVFSPGYDINPLQYAPLLEAWARAGYLVAEPEYPYTSPGAPGGLDEADILNHPRDLAFVIARLTSAGPSLLPSGLSLIGPGDVAVAGQSDGGDVALALTANPCCRFFTPRAALILSGAELTSFGSDYFSGGSVPLLVVQGTADTINPPGCSTEIYNQDPGTKYYLSLEGADHLGPYTEPGPAASAVEVVTIDFLNQFLHGDPSGLAGASTAVAGSGTLISGGTVPQAPGGCPGAPEP
ncbi:MAG: alpha/beta hydrolase family protein [Acidimicrobiales bacterium]